MSMGIARPAPVAFPSCWPMISTAAACPMACEANSARCPMLASEPSIKTWTDVCCPPDSRVPKSGGITITTLALPRSIWLMASFALLT